MARLAFQRAPSEYDDAFMDKMAGAYLEQTGWTRLRLKALLPLVEPDHPLSDEVAQAEHLVDVLATF